MFSVNFMLNSDDVDCILFCLHTILFFAEQAVKCFFSFLVFVHGHRWDKVLALRKGVLYVIINIYSSLGANEIVVSLFRSKMGTHMLYGAQVRTAHFGSMTSEREFSVLLQALGIKIVETFS